MNIKDEIGVINELSTGSRHLCRIYLSHCCSINFLPFLVFWSLLLLDSVLSLGKRRLSTPVLLSPQSLSFILRVYSTLDP
jgi:hypothetical protein